MGLLYGTPNDKAPMADTTGALLLYPAGSGACAKSEVVFQANNSGLVTQVLVVEV